MNSDNEKMNRKYIRARKRVEELRKYYWHLTVYVLINTIISIYKIINDARGGSGGLEEALTDFDNYSLWLWWGIGIAYHTYGTFGSRLFVSKSWEERKIKEFMDEK
ncbi:2TM domain-containing protein [Pseudotenacibaculum haliotis]|uniref:2TM domain-containing protein n=1 Tax=Pseudotenacibaculum haliotis TaxID=1862138 RepID=A0ABW5LU90_9FLAO